MPIYEYRCNRCSNCFEYLAKSTAAPAVPCPECGSSEVVKLPSSFSVGASRGEPRAGASCCGAMGGCDNPKRCCEA